MAMSCCGCSRPAKAQPSLARLKRTGNTSAKPGGPVLCYGARTICTKLAIQRLKASRTNRGPAQCEIYDIAWSPSGEYLLTGDTAKTARIWNATDGEHISFAMGNKC